MKTFVIGFLAAGGIAAGAHASFGFSYEFSSDDGATYGNDRTVDVTTGSATVRFRVVAYASPGTQVTTVNGTGPAVAFARITGSEVLTNWGSGANGDLLSSHFRGSMSAGNAAYLSNSISSGNTILGTTAPTSFAANLLLSGALAAYCPSSGGAPQLQWIVRTGVMTIGQAGGTRTIMFHNNSRTQSFWYHDLLINGAQEVNTATPDADLIDFAGTLHVIPAPGALALAGIAGAVGVRRRRG
ncbi:MAG: hypothetical protein KF691_12550 [Phycisphaeraceae bacterium]|nr:hypothetical protein [Phycisphaeraceae bacterium]